ncbi:MAG: flavin reductase family protein [Pseudomonadota bacterium]
MTIGIDSRDLRKVLGRFATGITVMTCQTSKHGLAGMTVNSFASLSLNPPLILWSIDKGSDQFDQFAESSHFAVNVLSSDQLGISNNFAKPSPDRFRNVHYSIGFSGAPLLEGVVAQLQCRVKERLEAGDHILIIGEVLHATSTDKEPLLYFGGQYMQLAKAETS